MSQERSPKDTSPKTEATTEVPDDLFYGINAVGQLVAQQPAAIEELIVIEGAKGRLAHLAKQARKEGVLLRYRPKTYFTRALPDVSHQGVIARMRSFSYASFDDLISHTEKGPLLFLVGVQDPGNMGALIRSAKAFGASGVLITRREGCAITPAVAKASVGATSDLPIAQVHQIQQAIEALKEAGWWLLGLHQEGQAIQSFDLVRPAVFVLGAEGKGLKPSVEKHCDAVLGIPMIPDWESLNVSVSGGIALYEWRRQNPLVLEIEP